MNRISIIQSLLHKTKGKSYLEIGVQAGHCFNTIECETKFGVDPDTGSAATHHITSDEFFKQYQHKFDVIFVDGLHHSEQAYKDIVNALECLNPGGFIVVHDCLPTNKHMQEIPLTDQQEWTGNVWEAWVKLRQERSDLCMAVTDADWGCGIITKGLQKPLVVTEEINYENFVKNKREWMNIISVAGFQQQFLV